LAAFRFFHMARILRAWAFLCASLNVRPCFFGVLSALTAEFFLGRPIRFLPLVNNSNAPDSREISSLKAAMIS
jgi:hypothetical protein